VADDEGSGEKTEKPTGKKLGQARSDGMVGVSADLSSVLSMTAAFYVFFYFSNEIWKSMLILLKSAFSFQDVDKQSIEIGIFHYISSPLRQLTPLIFFVMIAAAIFGSMSTLLQTNFLWSPKLFKPKFSHLNPINGIKKIFAISNFLNLLKSIAKIMIIAPIGYFSFMNFFPALLGLMSLPVSEFLPIGAGAIKDAFVKIMSLLFILAILDLAWQKWRTLKKLKMTKQEVKDEGKAAEGDQTTKRRILSLGMQRARQRMMKDVPKADVIVTNPTHISVALSYSGEPGTAPIVLAKGQGYVALRIREIAKENNIPIVERKPLARALFASVEVGKEIPYELFKAVAEVLAYIYRVKGRKPKKKIAGVK
jgi:flagellar biosynthetic protein FlhB